MYFSSLSGIFLLLGAVLAVISFLFLKFPPQEINALYGYRTKRSMRSQEAWDFSQKLAGKYLLRLSLVLFLFGVVFLFIDVSTWPGWAPMPVLLGVLFIGIAVMLVKTERKLARRFKNRSCDG